MAQNQNPFLILRQTNVVASWLVDPISRYAYILQTDSAASFLFPAKCFFNYLFIFVASNDNDKKYTKGTHAGPD